MDDSGKRGRIRLHGDGPGLDPPVTQMVQGEVSCSAV
jgi:hypothetical protein